MSSNLPLNGERLLNHLEGSLRKSPAVSLAQALGGVEAQLDEAVDGTCGSVKSYETSKAVDPSQGRGNPQRRGKNQDPLLESLIATVGRRNF